MSGVYEGWHADYRKRCDDTRLRELLIYILKGRDNPNTWDGPWDSLSFELEMINPPVDSSQVGLTPFSDGFIEYVNSLSLDMLNLMARDLCECYGCNCHPKDSPIEVKDRNGWMFPNKQLTDDEVRSIRSDKYIIAERAALKFGIPVSVAKGIRARTYYKNVT